MARSSVACRVAGEIATVCAGPSPRCRWARSSRCLHWSGDRGRHQLGIGLVLVSLGRKAGTDEERRKMYRLSAWFLVPAAGNLAAGYWYITIASPATA